MIPINFEYKGFQIKIAPTGKPSKPFQLSINDKKIDYRFVRARKKFYSHLFYREFSDLEEMAKAYIDVNPTLVEPHPHPPHHNNPEEG